MRIVVCLMGLIMGFAGLADASLHVIAVVASLAMIVGASWLIYVHFNSYADRIIDALLMGKGD